MLRIVCSEVHATVSVKCEMKIGMACVRIGSKMRALKYFERYLKCSRKDLSLGCIFVVSITEKRVQEYTSTLSYHERTLASTTENDLAHMHNQRLPVLDTYQ